MRKPFLFILLSLVILFQQHAFAGHKIEIKTNVPVKVYVYDVGYAGTMHSGGCLGFNGESTKAFEFYLKKDTKKNTYNSKIFNIWSYTSTKKVKKGQKDGFYGVDDYNTGEVLTLYRKYYTKAMQKAGLVSGYDSIVTTKLKSELIFKFVPEDTATYSTMIYQVMCEGSNFPDIISVSLPLNPAYIARRKAEYLDSMRVVVRDSLLSIGTKSTIKIKGNGLYFLSGESKNGFANGNAVAVSSDGNTVYTGTFVNGELISGKSETNNGASYNGSFKNNVPHGKGILTTSNQTVYDCSFVNGVGQGKSTVTYKDGAVFTGNLKDGLLDGKGKITFPDGGYFTGDFKDNKENGKGEMVKGNEKFIGTFKDGAPHGEGIFFDNNVPEKAEYYEGKRIDQAYLIQKENKRAELARQLELKEQREREELMAKQMKEWEEEQKGNKFLRNVVGFVLIAAVGSTFSNDAANGLSAGTTLNNMVTKVAGVKDALPGGKTGNGTDNGDLAENNKAAADGCAACKLAVKYKNKKIQDERLPKKEAGALGCYDQAAQLAYYNCLIAKLTGTGQDLSTLIQQRDIIKNMLKDCIQQYEGKPSECIDVLSGGYE